MTYERTYSDHFPDCPTDAHTHEPWTDDDTAELARAMADARWVTADRHSEARAGAVVHRAHSAPIEAPGCDVNRSAALLAACTREWREDRIADRMEDDPQPTDLPIVAVAREARALAAIARQYAPCANGPDCTLHPIRVPGDMSHR